jgi:seryl-tRNA synthetase
MYNKNMSRQIVEAYMQLRDKIKEHQKTLSALKDEEKNLVKEIQDYLNQTDEQGIRIDETTVITLTSNDKKINRTAKAYKSRLAELCSSKGIYDDAEFVDEILKAKVETTVQQQKLKIIKSK